MNLEKLFCQVDDFCIRFMPEWEAQLIEQGTRCKTWQCQMALSEIMTIMILFHQIQYRNFKTFYNGHVSLFLRGCFPTLLSYSRFVEQQKRAIMSLFFFMMSLPRTKTGIYFIDSTAIEVCHIKREKQHKVFAGLAAKSKSSMGWFFGFKLHILINACGEIIAFRFTKANVDDRQPVDDLTKNIVGKLFGDKGYISQALHEELLNRGLELVTRVRKNMKPAERSTFDKLILRKRAIVETVIDQLKNISQIEHTRHRSLFNFILNMIAGLTAYSLQPKKPSICVDTNAVVVV